MGNPQKKINIDEDRLSNLPGDVIERIMELISVPDAARTCVLSSKWRYVWVNHPSLVLDHTSFWNDRLLNKSLAKVVDNHDLVYANIVSSVLLSHSAHIRKFVIDISNVNVCHKNLDSWISYLCRKSLKVLHFTDSHDLDDTEYYEVPSCVFLTSQLTHLSLQYCRIKETVGCFNSIRSLILEYCRIDSVVLTTPLLTSLSVSGCFSFDADVVFDISAPKLASLTLDDNSFFNLQPFFTCTDIEHVVLLWVKCDGKHLLDLLALWPKVSVLVVDDFSFKAMASAGSIPDNDRIRPLNLRRFALWRINLDSQQMAWILCVLKNSPLLHTFEIRFGEEDVNDIDETSIMDFKMDQLRIINIEGFTASRNEVIFIDILLKCAPLLEKMLVEENKNLDSGMQIKILKELLLLQRKYRNTEIIFAQNIVPQDF